MQKVVLVVVIPSQRCVRVSGLSANAVVADRIIRIEPGLWEYTHTLEIPGLLAPTTTPKTECVTDDDAQRNLSDLLAELSTGGNCDINNLKDNLNTAKLDLTCKPEIGSMTISADGQVAVRYGRTKITASATGLISVGEMDMVVNASGEANRIGRCED